jgi:hypothetical protein
MLEEICKDEDVLEVTGEYTGGIGGWGASHEHRELKHRYEKDDALSSSSFSTQNQQQEQELLMEQQLLPSTSRKIQYDSSFSGWKS